MRLRPASGWLRGDDQHHLLVVERLEPEVGRPARPVGDAEVELAGAQLLADLVGGELLDPHPHRRMAGQEQRDALRNQADVEGVRRADPHLPGQAAAAGLEHGDALVDLLQRARREAEEQLAGLGGDDLLADAVEQRLADLFLELADLVREGRLGHVDPLRGPREAQALGQGDEVAKMPQLHENPAVESMPSIISMRKSLRPCADATLASAVHAGERAAGDRGEPMSEYNQERLTQDVVDAFAKTPDPRLREIMTALVKHVHAFAREVDLKPEEWLAGLQFLTRTGQISTDKRPEFILLSDTLGLSMMVVSLAQARASGKRDRRDAGDRGDGRRARSTGRARPTCRSAATSAKACRASRRSTWAASPTATASRWPARCSTSGRATATASTTCSSRPSRR